MSDMHHMIQLRPGSCFVRNPGRRRRARYSRKRFIISTLLLIAIGVQLVMAGRYTMSMIFAVDIPIANISATDDTITYTTENSSQTINRNRNMTAYNASINNKIISHDSGGLGLLFSMKDDATAARKALRKVGNRTCFVEGLYKQNDERATTDGCRCKDDWFGTSCSIPGFINRSPTRWAKDSLRVRDRPRRIIYAFPFHIEFEMLEIRFAELAEVVDVYLILESNYTASGCPKPLHLLDRIRNGTIQNMQAEKVVHVFLDYFPQKAYKNGWVADALHRNYLGTHGLRRLGGLRTDDLLVLTDADELPRRQLLSFLKWHDGYSQPVIVNYRWSVYGFFWGVPSRNGVIQTQKSTAVTTVAMAVYMFRYQIYSIRDAVKFLKKAAFDYKVTAAAAL